jgi:hypothetical protein
LLDIPSDPPAELYGARITQNLFPALGVAPAFGRNFLPEEDQLGRGQSIILSDSLWKTRFGANPNIVGKTIRLAGQSECEEYVVVGAMPAGFNFPLTIPTAVNPLRRQMAYWLPLAKDPLRRDQSTFVIPIGLLRSGLPVTKAQNDLATGAGEPGHLGFARLAAFSADSREVHDRIVDGELPPMNNGGRLGLGPPRLAAV